jgi:hypothetical protein
MLFAPFRYYMPGAGRWLTRDPLGMVDEPNVYAYVRGNPPNRRDPLGLNPLDILKIPAAMRAAKECRDEAACMNSEEFMKKYGSNQMSAAMAECVRRKTGLTIEDVVKAGSDINPKVVPGTWGRIKNNIFSCGVKRQLYSGSHLGDFLVASCMLYLLLALGRRRTKVTNMMHNDEQN